MQKYGRQVPSPGVFVMVSDKGETGHPFQEGTLLAACEITSRRPGHDTEGEVDKGHDDDVKIAGSDPRCVEAWEKQEVRWQQELGDVPHLCESDRLLEPVDDRDASHSHLLPLPL